jgi:hypothetical protein
MDKAIEIVESKLLRADNDYNAKTYEMHLARQFGKKSELVKLRKEEELLWATRQAIADLLVELKKEAQPRNDQADFIALLGAFGGRK